MILSWSLLWITLKLSVPNKVQNLLSVQKKQKLDPKNVFERGTSLKRSSSLKTCDLDPIRIPTSVLKNSLDIIITPITDIINISMETSTFPQNFQESHVRLLLKKTSLPKNELKILQACIQLEFHFQNRRKRSSQSAASSYIKITVSLIDYNQPIYLIYRKHRFYRIVPTEST